MSNKPQKSKYDFSKMVAFDFNSMFTNSTNNCFSCDCCDAEFSNKEYGSCDMSYHEPEYEAPKQVSVDKFKGASDRDLLKSIAVSLERIAEAEEYRNKILLTGVQTRVNHF